MTVEVKTELVGKIHWLVPTELSDRYWLTGLLADQKQQIQITVFGM